MKMILKLATKLTAEVALCLMLVTPVCDAQEQPGSTVIVNAQIADGTGAALRKANVRIEGDRIASIGDFKPRRGERVIDASQGKPTGARPGRVLSK